MKYKVLQPFIDYENLYYSQGSTFCPDHENMTTFQQDFIDHLDSCMFIEEISEQPKTVWDLKDGDKCYFINFNGTSNYVSSICFDDVSAVLREIGNIFVTREEAKKEIARRKAKQILLRDTKGFKPDWCDKSKDKWEVYYGCHVRSLKAGFCTAMPSHRDLWFANQEDAEASIKTHTEEWLCYLNIED